MQIASLRKLIETHGLPKVAKASSLDIETVTRALAGLTIHQGTALLIAEFLRIQP